MHTAPTPQQSHLVPGYRLDRYELLYPLAQGGMATVWVSRLLGKHGFEKLIAIKTILPQYADDPAFQKMFLDEARIASMIRHPNVAEIIDLGEADNTLYIAMEYVDGDSWSKLHNAAVKAGSRIPISLLLRIAADAAAGLHAAHELRAADGQLLQVVHRDVSPQNVLVGMNGHTKLIDFGVAKARDRMSQETSAGLVKGKIQYASPEQALGGDVDRRTDIWALATILYQMLAGRLPYDADNQVAMLHMLTSGHPPPALPGSVPPAVAQVIMRALQPQREHRFASCAEFQAALESVMPERATTHDVSAFSRQFLADRATSRQQDLANALAASAQRNQQMGSQTEMGGARPQMQTQMGGFGMSSPMNPGLPQQMNQGMGSGMNQVPMQGQMMGMQHTPASGSTQAAMAVPVQANMTTMGGIAGGGPASGKTAMRGSQWVAVIGAVATSFVVWTGSGIFALRANAADAAAATAKAPTTGADPAAADKGTTPTTDPPKAEGTEPPKTAEPQTDPPKTPPEPPKTAEPAKTADGKTSKTTKADPTPPVKTAEPKSTPAVAVATPPKTPPATGTTPPKKKKKVDDGF